MRENRNENGYKRSKGIMLIFALAPDVKGITYKSPPIVFDVSVPSDITTRKVTEPPVDGVMLPSFNVTAPYKSLFVLLS